MINIIIVNYFSTEKVKSLVDRLTSKCFRFFVIDNSNDDPDKLMNLGNVIYLSKGCNLGYAGGNNFAFEYISINNIDGDIFILNPDVTISVNSILEMHKILTSDLEIGQVYCSAYDENNDKIYDSISLNGLIQTWHTGNSGVLESAYAAGSAMLINRKVLSKNIFDERYFLYWEEVDLSLKIKEKGFKVIVNADVACIRESNSTDRKIKAIYYITRNAFLIFYKFKNVTFIDLFYFQIKQCFICVKSLVMSKSLLPVKYFFLGIIDGIRKKFGPF